MDQTIGAYCFVGQHWKENDLPLDLFLEHSINVFDKISLVVHGDQHIPNISPKVKITRIEPMEPTNYQFYIKSQTIAMQVLDTDWKVLMPVDEFLIDKIDTGLLNKKYAYAVKVRQLFGNLGTEMVVKGVFPMYQFRIHYGDRQVIKDGGDVVGPYMARTSLKKFIELGLIQAKVAANSIFSKKGNGAPNPNSNTKTRFMDRLLWGISMPIESKSFEAWHTGYLRNPKAMKRKLREETLVNKNENVAVRYKEREMAALKEGEAFDYGEKLWPDADFVKVLPNQLPRVLIDNKDRFNWVKQ